VRKGPAFEGRVGRASVAEGPAPPALQAFRKGLARYVTGPVAKLLARTPVTPNALTAFSFLVTLGAVWLVAQRHLIGGGLVVLFASVFDMFDGALARETNRVTKFGAALDSTLDRLAEGAIFLALMWFYTQKGSQIGVGLAGMAMISSFLVSYVRARAEGLGVECEVGIFTRTERIAVLVLGLLLSGFGYAMPAALLVIAILSSITVGQRLFQIWRKTRA
jgi:CDP-diacylglycerol--glycerol-3-phosphate 3-phosphatidyltransferase